MNDRTPSFFALNVHPWGLLSAAGVVASAATPLGFLGRFYWFFDLFSHFRVQYSIVLLVLGLLLLIGRQRKTAAAFLTLACVNLVLLLQLYLGAPPRSEPASTTLRAMLLNVNTNLGDADRVQAEISAVDPDILVLEEISARWISELEWLDGAYPHSLLRPRGDNFGIGLYSKLPLSEGEVVYIGAAQVPSILATVDTGDTDLQLIATHPPPPIGGELARQRNDQLERLPDFVRTDLPVLLLGDLNASPWSYHFQRLLARSGLHDSTQGYGVQPTWPSHIFFLQIPIDHCLHSPDIAIVDRKIGENVSSDHYPLIVDFVIGKNPNRQRSTTGSNADPG